MAAGSVLILLGLALLFLDLAQSAGRAESAASSQSGAERSGEIELRDKVINHLDRAIVVCGRDGEVSYCNDQARALFHAPKLVGMNLFHVVLAPSLRSLVEEVIASTSDEMVTRDLEVDYPERLSLRVQACKVGADTAVVWIADVSDIRHLETVRRDFVANVSHELRTPMASIRVMAESLEDDESLTEDERNRYLQKIIAEVDRLTLLSDDLLTLASSEAKPAEKSEIDIAEIARDAVQQMEQPASAKGLTLELDAPARLIALGDRPRVIQILLNLLQNAIRYTNTGGAKVRVYEEGVNAVIEVRDSGIGIGVEHLPRIFERFYRVDAARSRETGGTGLGLAIVKHIAESLGGKVELESELGRGSTFRVRLPL